MLFIILLVPLHLSPQSLYKGQLYCYVLYWLRVPVLDLVQVALEELKDYKQEEGYIQSAHVNHQYHHHNHYVITNQYSLVVGYQTVANPLFVMQDHQDLM